VLPISCVMGYTVVVILCLLALKLMEINYFITFTYIQSGLKN